MFCLQCGRNSGEKESGGTKLFQSEKLERQYSQDPNFCNDMNPSGRDSFLLLRKLQQSEKRNVGIEEGIMKTLEEVREQREDNRFMGLAAIRVTAGYMAGVGEHDSSQPEILEVMEVTNSTEPTKPK